MTISAKSRGPGFRSPHPHHFFHWTCSCEVFKWFFLLCSWALGSEVILMDMQKLVERVTIEVILDE